MNRKMILDPFWLVLGLFSIQSVFWFLMMPDTPTLSGAAPRYSSYLSISLFVLLWSSLLVGIVIGKVIANSSPNNFKRSKSGPNSAWLKTLFTIAKIALLFSFIGELVYLREIIFNPGLIVKAFEIGDMANLGEEVKAIRVIGISSLNNLFIVPSAIYAMIFFNPQIDKSIKQRTKTWLIIIGCASIVHAILFSARMFTIYFISIVIAAYMINKPIAFRIRFSTILKIIGFPVVVIWVGELLRGGLWYSTNSGLSLLSIDTQIHIIDRLVQGYFAADFNNAMVLLDYPSTYQFFSTTAFKSMMSNVIDYSFIPNWSSSFGTVNILGLWWFDWGVLSFILCLLVGGMLGIAYKKAEWSSKTISPVSLLFIVAYPGIWSMIRTNYFSATIFIIPFVFILLAVMVADILNCRSGCLRSENRNPIYFKAIHRHINSYSKNWSSF